jgi:hypothetical protein
VKMCYLCNFHRLLSLLHSYYIHMNDIFIHIHVCHASMTFFDYVESVHALIYKWEKYNKNSHRTVCT